MRTLVAMSIVVGLASSLFAQTEPASVPITPIQSPGVAPAQQAHPKADAKPIYDTSADARKDIAAALAVAARENRRVLIQWGGNWCGWCQMLHHTFETDKPIAHELLYEYVVVPVDIGHFDKNTDLATQYGATLKESGVPFLTVLSADGKPIANQETGALEKKPTEADPTPEPGHDTAKVLAFLKAHEATPRQASAVLDEAKAQAKASGKTVLVRWGAPWCGWCHKMDDWLARPEVASLIDKDYVSIKIDQDRMPGGKELLAASGGADKGIPWFAMMDPSSGSILGKSEIEGKNIGFPSQPEEIDCFIGMVIKTAKHLSQAEIATLRKTLEKPAEERASR